jgi:predicted dehydrogenase/GNAT superfamily N-acetyltransferase
MGVLEKLNVGVVGAAGRGGAFRAGLEANGARVHAVCDIRREALEESARRMGARETYVDYERMLGESELDAVVIGTPMQHHAAQSLLAVRRGIHVLSEVPACVSVEECQELVLACRASTAVYMMAENYAYLKPNVLVRELVRQGLFGTPYYAEGEYLHELKELNEATPWRRAWQTGIDGVTYGTHSLGPILQWMPGDRVVRVCCEGSGRRHADPRGVPYHQDSAVMLCKTARGALIKIRVDMVSDRPHAMTNYCLQGTEGCYESGRGGPVDRGKIWLRALGASVEWHDAEELGAIRELADRYLPQPWRDPPAEALAAGHGGGDYFEVLDFIRAIRGEAPCPIGIDEAMDITLPGLVSQGSIAQGGGWLPVPDSRAWTLEAPPRQQLQMVWPEDLAGSPPAWSLPSGYEMRQYRDLDFEGYVALMAKAGFVGWTAERLRDTLVRALPDGFFVVEHAPTGRIVATTMALHHPMPDLHPYGGELGWVAGDPEHAGKGMGSAVCAAATARLLRGGYRRVYLRTDDFRLPAVRIYLKLGYRPLLHAAGMEERWRAVCERLGMPFQPVR